jgi:hypothetical protein
VSKGSPADPDRKAPPAGAGGARDLFQYELRRDGRVVVLLHGTQSPAGVTVETSVFPITSKAGEGALPRPFTFGSADQARRFADEVLTTFEYLNCTVA